MALTREQIEDIFSRVPIVSPPPSIYQLANADVSAQRLYNLAHQLNASVRQYSAHWRILGMHEMGTSFVLLAGDAPESTAVHEAVHHMGVASEPATYAITRALMARARFSLGIRRRPVHYVSVPTGPAEVEGFLRTMHLSVAPGETRNVELVHLVYTPGG